MNTTSNRFPREARERAVQTAMGSAAVGPRWPSDSRVLLIRLIEFRGLISVGY